MIPRYRKLAMLLESIAACRKAGNVEMERRHIETLKEELVSAPSGSGFDHGTTFDAEASSTHQLIFSTKYHHMNDGGMYDGWTEHTVKVRPDLAYKLIFSVTGPNRNEIKDYICDVFNDYLTEEVSA